MASVEARLKAGNQRKYPELDPAEWYPVVPIFPGVTQRMVNMAGERLTRLSTPRGFLIAKAEHLDFRYDEARAAVPAAPAEGPER